MKIASFAEDGWQLQSLDEHWQEYAGTFEVLPLEVRSAIAPGQIVKLAFRMLVEDEMGEEQEVMERMWVKVIARKGSLYHAELNNNAQYAEHMVAGVDVAFEPAHVIQIWSDPS